jgi:hypothetical protein
MTSSGSAVGPINERNAGWLDSKDYPRGGEADNQSIEDESGPLIWCAQTGPI